MLVLAYDAYPNEEYALQSGIQYVSLQELYARSDVISRHWPMRFVTSALLALGRKAKNDLLPRFFTIKGFARWHFPAALI